MFTRFSLSAVFMLWFFDSVTEFVAAIRAWFMSYLGWIGIAIFVILFVALLHVWQLHLLALPGAQ